MHGVRGIDKVVVDVEDLDRAIGFWRDELGFELVIDEPYGNERWVEVRTPDERTTLVLRIRTGPRPVPPDPMLPTSNVFFYAEDLPTAYGELQRLGVPFPVPPVEQPFGWWSVFEDPDGNRFALSQRS